MSVLRVSGLKGSLMPFMDGFSYENHPFIFFPGVSICFYIFRYFSLLYLYSGFSSKSPVIATVCCSKSLHGTPILDHFRSMSSSRGFKASFSDEDGHACWVGSMILLYAEVRLKEDAVGRFLMPQVIPGG